jgi:hypothetical protein
MGPLVIEEQGRPAPAVQALESWDLQDGLLIAGMVFAESGALVIWWPSALILAALFCFGFAYLLARGSKAKRK